MVPPGRAYWPREGRTVTHAVRLHLTSRRCVGCDSCPGPGSHTVSHSLPEQRYGPLRAAGAATRRAGPRPGSPPWATLRSPVRPHAAPGPRWGHSLGNSRSPVRLHAAPVLDGVTPLGNSTLAGAATRAAPSSTGVTPLGNSTLAGAATRCTGPRRGHTLGNSTLAGAATRCTGLGGVTPWATLARRCGYTLHWSSRGHSPGQLPRSPVRLHAAPRPSDVVTPLNPGQLYARRCGHTLHWPSMGSPPGQPSTLAGAAHLHWPSMGSHPLGAVRARLLTRRPRRRCARPV